MSEHDRWTELAAGHALSALEPEDEQAFLDHVRGCDVCVKSLADFRGVTSRLAYTAEPAEPPPIVLDRIMESISATGEAGPSLLSTPTPAQRRLGSRPAAGRALPGRTFGRSWVLSAAAALIILVLGLWNATLRADNDRLVATVALRRQFERMATDPRATVVHMGEPGRPRGLAVVLDGRAMLLVDGVDTTIGGDFYVLWARDRAERLVAIDKFEAVNPSRPNLVGPMTVEIPLTDVTRLAVSHEPGPDVPTAPTLAIMSGDLPA